MSILSSTKTGKSALLIPETKEELMEMIKKEIMKNGFNCNLNHIKTHKITDMSFLFSSTSIGYSFQHFDGDISKWDVSKVTSMRGMFWDSRFNGDISNWNVSNVKLMNIMFKHSEFNKDISKWDVSGVEDMSEMFCNSNFNQDISNWKINPKCDAHCMFLPFDLMENKYKPKQNGIILQ